MDKSRKWGTPPTFEEPNGGEPGPVPDRRPGSRQRKASSSRFQTFKEVHRAVWERRPPENTQNRESSQGHKILIDS